MLTNVPSAINQLARNVVLNHPNSYLGELYRQVVNRISDTTAGGAPTKGGMMVLSSDDESDLSWTLMGNIYVLELDQFEPAMMMDRQDANNGSIDEFRFLIEAETLAEFEINKRDVIYTNKNGLIKLAFQVVDIETTSNIPPYTQRYVCNRRNDLDLPV